MDKKQLTKGLTITFLVIVSIFTKVLGQVPPVGKYDTTNYPKDRKIINAISNNFDPSLFLNDDYVGIGADGKISYGLSEELKTFGQSNISFKSISVVPNTALLRIFNGITAVKTKIVDVVFDSPNGDVHVKVIRTETYVKQKGKWYYVLGQGTNFMTQVEYNEFLRLHTKAK